MSAERRAVPSTSTTTAANDPDSVRAAEPTQPDIVQPDIVFHPDFNTPPTATIFQSSDDICFRFDIDILAPVSAFFADLRDIGGALVPNDSNAVIPLPNATARALSFTFRLLSMHLNLRAHEVLDCPDEIGLDEFIDVIKAYDLGMAAKAFLDARFSDGHWVLSPIPVARLVVASVGGAAGPSSMPLSLLLGYNISGWALRHISSTPMYKRAREKGTVALHRLLKNFTAAVASGKTGMIGYHQDIVSHNLDQLMMMLPGHALYIVSGINFIDNSLKKPGRVLLRRELRRLDTAIHE
ncbi:uncharacterized protein LOC62_04G006582 [Vanrija pseudolonga]|uniref:Uncharacterized protein n=1 Tax=Vanrija pseudolonga TaxID=143232 RepID=A0AAF0YEL3_9TREE|nr:hypothetical protein LOC62_04G006582 [Vanrija pseudolonga]